MRQSLLIVPACERGRGGGHLGRSLYLFKALREMGRSAYLWIPPHLADDAKLRFKEFFEDFDKAWGLDGAGQSRLVSSSEKLVREAWSFIILDFFATSARELEYWAALAPVIGIDEGGVSRRRFDFLIDLLPSPNKIAPNVISPALLPLPRKRRPLSRAVQNPPRILISFGAEDSRGLGFSACRSLAASSLKQGRTLSVTIVAPVPARSDSDRKLFERAGIKVVGKFPNLKEHLESCDLFITHFGLGAFEAVYAKVPVLLVSPTSYHEKLAGNAGFFSAGKGERGIRRLARLGLDGEFIKALCERGETIAENFGLAEAQKKDLPSFIDSLSFHGSAVCPVCARGKKGGTFRPETAAARFAAETFRRCGKCGIIYMSRFDPPPVEYAKDYFFASYKNQYGKTYLEDFPNLVETGRKRLSRVKAILNQQTRRGGESKEKALLDIGCAYGPFLKAAAEAGFSPLGIEPAEDAARYVNDNLKLRAIHGFFPLLPDEGGNLLQPESFDAVTLWYVIEHFEDSGKVLEEINRILKTGGVLAFSTPSFSGISGRKSLKEFLRKSPEDHFTVWSPRVCKKVLEKYGFSLCGIVVTGHHPERFPFLGRFLSASKKGIFYSALFLVSRLFRLGDTFEAYAVKNR